MDELWVMLRLAKHLIILLFLFVCACSKHGNHQAQGYIEGRYTYMASSVSGQLKELLVERGSQVKKGQKLFVLEQQPESDIYEAEVEDLKEATSARDATSANLSFIKLTYERYKQLVPKHAIAQADLDSAQSNYFATVAQLAQANANIAKAYASVAQSKWTLEQKTISSPVDAVVFDTYYRLGEYTIKDQAILSLLAPADIKAIFYISEPELGHIKLGDFVSVRCNGCDKTIQGRISFISPSAEYTPPVIYSNQTNEKLIYRIEAEFSAQDAVKLHPGQPVYVTYHHD